VVGDSAVLTPVSLAGTSPVARLTKNRKALRGVDEYHRGVDGGQHPVSVFGEVGVAWGVEQLMMHVRYANCNAVDVIEIPLAFSISIQSHRS
jgi:hypothetical protein